jgi:multisubunit Na+/H+ antiporter MnhG subunit
VSFREVAAAVLLVLGVAVQLAGVAGVTAMPHLFDRLHFLTPISVVGPALIAGGAVVRDGFGHTGIQALVMAGMLILLSPVVGHVTARTARIRAGGDWRPRPGERVRRP